MVRKWLARRSTPFALVALAGVIAPATALAYLLPAEVIFSGAAKRRADIAFSTIVVEGTYQRGDAPPVRVWEAIREGKAHRVERKSDAGTEVLLTVPGKRWSFKLGERSKAERWPSDLILDFLGTADKDGGGQRGVAFLKQRGIDADEVSLARQDKRPCYVIGAKPWEPTKPQLWIDKSLLVPVRLVEVDKNGSVTETRLLGIGSEVTNEWFPRRIEVWRDGKLVEATTYTSARLNEEVSEDLFRPPS